MHRIGMKLLVVTCALALTPPLLAYTYSEEFNTNAGGWGGDNTYYSATGGIGDSGYTGGQRAGGLFPYLQPIEAPASDALLGDVKTRFGGRIRLSYHVKVIAGGPPNSMNFYVFGEGGNIWARTLPSSSLTDWTLIRIEFDPAWTDAQAQAAGWYNGPWQGGAFSAVWNNVVAYNFLSGQGSGDTDTGIDNVTAETITQFTPPPNDACVNAEPVVDGQISGVQWSATSDGASSCGDAAGAPDVWYAYTATCSESLIVRRGNGNTYSPVVSVHSACPGTAGNQLGCAKLNTSSDFLAAPVTSGQTYYLRVSASAGEMGSFALTVSCGPVPGTLPYLNDFTSLKDLNTTISEKPITAESAAAPGGKSGSALHLYNSEPGAYVQLTPNVVSIPDAVTVRFRLYIVTNPDFIGVYQYPPGEGLVVRPDGTFGESFTRNSLNVPWQANTWYSVAMVLPGNGMQDVFIRPGAAAQPDGSDFKGTIGGGGHPMSSSVFFDYAGDYYIADYSIEAGNTVPPAPPPPNDGCDNPAVLTNGTTTASTVGATSDGDASCGNSGGAPDIWYRWTATCSDHLTIIATSGTITPAFSVHSACPGNLSTEVACASGLFNPLLLSVTEGQQYLIRVAGAGNAPGSVTFNVSCGPPPPVSTVLYCDTFTDLKDMTPTGNPTLTPNVPAPGGKEGVALQIDGVSGSYVALQPSGVAIPNDSTTVFRIYITSRTNFMGVYNYRPGEGLRFMAEGGLQHSNGAALPGSWAFNTWYTVALHVPGNGVIEMYLKEGASAQLSAADLLGSTAGPGGAMFQTVFFNYGGQYYIADYTVNRGLDLSVCTDNVCHTPFADVDSDVDVDMDDFGYFQRCYTGAGLGPVPSGQGYEYCRCLDRPEPGYPNGNNDVSPADFQKFLQCASGPAVPAVTNCGG